MLPKISVIIPVYNAEKYAQICITRVLKQTFVDFELLLVDERFCRNLPVSAVLRSLHIGFENFGRVLTEYDHVITDILNIRQKNGQYSENNPQ